MNRENGKVYREIPLANLRPGKRAVREIREEPSLDELTENLRQVGLIHPLTVRYCGEGEYEIVSGVRRYLAASRLGWEKVPCAVTQAEDGQAALLSLSENIQRKNLNFFEEAEGMRTVASLLGLTQQELADRLGKSQSSVANKLRLLQLSDELRERILAGKLTERHARALLTVEGDLMRKKVLRITVARRYRVSQMEAYIEKEKRKAALPASRKGGIFKGFCRDLRLYLNTIDRTVDLLKNSGFCTDCETTDDGGKIIYRIEISKDAAMAGSDPVRHTV